MKDTPGKGFDSPVIVDGWKAYSYLTIMQRCWAHLIRKVEAFIFSRKEMNLSDKIHSMFTELEGSLKSEDMDERRSMKDLFDRRMEGIVRRYDQYIELHKTVEYIRNGLGLWFSCL